MLSRITSTLLACCMILLSHTALSMSKVPSGYTETRYPIVLAHGLFGFDELLGVNYWYKVPEALKKDGAQVFVTSVSAANSTEIRGEQLIPQIEQILAITGAQKVNIIGHSHGGPTARYVASVRPDLVASVSTIAGVNKPTVVADKVSEWVDGSDEFANIIETLGNGIATVINDASGKQNPQDILAALAALSTEKMTQFNAEHPGGLPPTACGEGDYEANGIRYYSWSGVQPFSNAIDPLDIITVGASLFFPAGVQNDGLVSRCDSHLGMVIRDDFRMNHFDEINQMLGLRDITATDPVSVFRTHANRLKQAGL